MVEPDIDADIEQIFGGEVAPIETDADEIEVSLAVRCIRDQLMETAQSKHVGVNQLAKRLHISPSAVSRTFSGEGDMRISTAVLYGRALGCRWDMSLVADAFVPDSLPPLLGKPLPLPRPEPIKEPDATTLGYGWELSEDARHDIAEIQEVLRQAEQLFAGVISTMSINYLDRHSGDQATRPTQCLSS